MERPDRLPRRDGERDPSGTSAPTRATAAPATSAFTTGRVRLRTHPARCSSSGAAERRSPAASGRPREAPRSAPGIVITTGSVQAPEGAVLVRGHDARETRLRGNDIRRAGTGPLRHLWGGSDRTKECQHSRRPPFTTARRTRSTSSSPPGDPLRPAQELTRTGTVHAPKQERRVAEGRNAAFNPLLELLGPVGSGSSDTHSAPPRSRSSARRTPRQAIVAYEASRSSAMPSVALASLPGRPASRRSRSRHSDFRTTTASLPPLTQRSRTPRPRTRASAAYAPTGVDTAQINIRGGTHYEFSYIPNPAFGATLAGWTSSPGTRRRGSTSTSRGT